MNDSVSSALIGTIAALMCGCKVPSTLRDQWEKYWVRLCVSVLSLENDRDGYIVAFQNLKDVVRQPMPGRSFDSILAYEIVRDMVTGFAMIYPQHVHVLICNDGIRNVASVKESGAESQLTVPVYLQGVIAGVVKGLNFYAIFNNSDIFDLIRDVGNRVGEHLANAHSNSWANGDLLPKAESDLGREVVLISQMRGNPFGQAFLSGFWAQLGKKGRAELLHRQYGLTKAILMSFAIRHIGNLPIEQLMELIVPQVGEKLP